MSYLIQPQFVRYECTCGSLKLICDLYFCRHCLELRCGYCLCHEVDSHYCSNCLEHLPSAEAKLKKNRCGSCLDCPNCLQTLSVRATTRNSEDPKNPTKHYYLACFFCRWTTREAGIPDQTIATGSWPVKENPHAAALSTLIEHYKIVAFKERSEKEKKTFATPRKGYSSYSDKYGLTAAMARKRAGLPPPPFGGKELSLASLPLITPSVAVDQAEPLPESFFNQVPDLTKITTLEQRLANPALQAAKTSSLHPQNRHFNIKRSLRCRKCEHSVLKPEYNPSSIKFKIQLSAYYHMPEVRIMKLEPLIAGETGSIVLKITNPMQHLTSVIFGQLPTREEELVAAERNKAIKEALKENSNDPSKVGEVKSLPIPPKNLNINATVELPTTPVVLPPRDDAAEYDDAMDTHSFHDDPKVVVWRKGNSAAVKLLLTPGTKLSPGEKVSFGFNLEYGYVNTMPALEQRTPQRAEMQVKVFVTPGEISVE